MVYWVKFRICLLTAVFGFFSFLCCCGTNKNALSFSSETLSMVCGIEAAHPSPWQTASSPCGCTDQGKALTDRQGNFCWWMRNNCFQDISFMWKPEVFGAETIRIFLFYFTTKPPEKHTRLKGKTHRSVRGCGKSQKRSQKVSFLPVAVQPGPKHFLIRSSVKSHQQEKEKSSLCAQGDFMSTFKALKRNQSSL